MAEATIYFGWRNQHGCQVKRITAGKITNLPPGNHVRNHSPDGFEWGYCGSGPAHLALALCLDCLADPADAEAVHQDVKNWLVAKLRGDEWILRETKVRWAILRARVPLIDGHLPPRWKRKLDQPQRQKPDPEIELQVQIEMEGGKAE